MSNQTHVIWLSKLRERVQAWLRAVEASDEARWNAHAENTRRRSPWCANRTKDYVDLIFAFRLARIGGEVESRAARQNAAALADLDPAHSFLLEAFSRRIAEANAGRSHAGPLPEFLLQKLERMDRLLRYVVDRLRKHSRILEPDVIVNPYYRWAARTSEFSKQLVDLEGQSNPDVFQSEADRLLSSLDGRLSDGRCRIESIVLRQSRFARVDQVLAAVKYVLSQAEAQRDSGVGTTVPDVAAALSATARLGSREELLSLTAVVRHWVTQNLENSSQYLPLIRSSIEALSAIDGPHGPEELIADISRSVLGALSPAEWMARATTSDTSHVLILLTLAERWYRFGRDDLADPIIHGALSLVRVVRDHSEETERLRTRMAVEIVRTLRSTSPPISDDLIKGLLEASPEFLAAPTANARDDAATKTLVATLEGITDSVLRRNLESHATMERQWTWAAHQQRRLAPEIVRSLRFASRAVAALHIEALLELRPRIRDTYTTNSHFNVATLDFVELLCLTAVEVCSHG